MGDIKPLDLDKQADINKKLEESVYDSQYWIVSIPDLPPSTSIPLQFAWVFEDGTVSDYSAYKTFITADPLTVEVADLAAEWVGLDLVVTFNSTDTRATEYYVNFTPYGNNTGNTIGITIPRNQSSTQQKVTLFAQTQKNNYNGKIKTQFTINVASKNPDGVTDGIEIVSPILSNGINGKAIPDTSWSLTSVSNGVLVNWILTDEILATKDYDYTIISYKESTSSSWTTKQASSAYKVELDNFNNNDFKIQHFGFTGTYSAESSVKQNKAFDPIEFDSTAPDSIINPTAAWSGQNLVVSFTMPSSNIPTSVKVHLTYEGETRYIEKYLNATSGSTSVTLTGNEIFGQFGASPSSFSSGYVTDLDIYRNENTTQVSISGLSSVTKPNPLYGKTTTISVSALSNGYSVSSNFDSSATGIKIYQSSSQNGTYTLVASSNSSPVIVYDESNAGSTVWVKGVWTSVNGNATESSPASVMILDVGALSVIENPITIATGGSIFTGTVLNGSAVESGARAVFNKRGLFFYDDSDTNGTGATTQIIGDASTNAATFITTRAKIGDWVVAPGKIENTLHAGTDSYTGLSPNGTYAFWAGSAVAGGYSSNVNNDAKFSVTKGGLVTARNINILGGKLRVGGDTDSAAPFLVETSGVLTAKDANLSGTINAASGILGSMQIGGTIKVNGIDTVVAGQLKITDNSAKVEIGKLTGPSVNSNTAIGVYGIQGTDGTNQYWQLDGVNGLIAKRGKIGNWSISNNFITSTKVGLYSPTGVPADTDIAIWAGGAPTTTDGVVTGVPTNPTFKVTYAGLLTASGATIGGTIKATAGGFGTFGNDGNISDGWQIYVPSSGSPEIKSTSGNLILKGDGNISGGTITGSKFQTSSSSASRRIVIDSAAPNTISFYSSSTDDANIPGFIEISDDAGILSTPGLVMKPPTNTSWGNSPFIHMSQTAGGGLSRISSTILELAGWVKGTSNFNYNVPAHRNISADQGVPSGGLEGDIYFQL